jgi:hypothetical protein
MLTRGLRAAGVEADTMVFDFGDDAWLCRAVDVNLGLDHCGAVGKAVRIPSFLLKAALHYDIFHFHSGRTLLPLWVDSRWSPVPRKLRPRLSWLRRADFADLGLLKRLGKKLVFSFWGCDIRKPTPLADNPDYICHYCTPQERQCNTPFRKKLIEALRRYGDGVTMSGDLIHSWPGYHWMPNAIDTREWDPAMVLREMPEKYRMPRDDRLMVLHSFANGGRRGDHKGTFAIRETVDSLIRQGVPLKFMEMDKVPTGDLKYLQVQADIVIDQFRLGCYGSFAMESMALARPVVGWINPDLYKDQESIPPVVSTPLQTLEDALLRLARDRRERERIGRKSRSYVEKFHDHRSIGRSLKVFYESLYVQ